MPSDTAAGDTCSAPAAPAIVPARAAATKYSSWRRVIDVATAGPPRGYRDLVTHVLGIENLGDQIAFRDAE